jgi:hypothetical protein
MRQWVWLPLLLACAGCGVNGVLVVGPGSHGIERPPLEKAALEGDLSDVQRLLAGGANPNGECVLCTAVQRPNNTAVIKALIAAGANPSGPNPAKFGCLSPLLTAADTGDLDNLRDLFSAGASFRRPIDCVTFAFEGVRWKPPVLDLLVQHGLNLQDVNDHGANVLHFALWYDVPNSDTIDYLIAPASLSTAVTKQVRRPWLIGANPAISNAAQRRNGS